MHTSFSVVRRSSDTKAWFSSSKLHLRRLGSSTEDREGLDQLPLQSKQAKSSTDKKVGCKSCSLEDRDELLRSVFSAVHFNRGRFVRPFFLNFQLTYVVTVTKLYSKSVIGLVQWSLCFKRPSGQSSALAALGMPQPWTFGSLKSFRDLGLDL